MAKDDGLIGGSALALRDRMMRGEVTAVDVAQACIARIMACEDTVQAWVHVDEDSLLRQACALDDLRASGAGTGPLHGLPIGIKDVIDTAGIPTENGTVLDAGRVPEVDATVVARLKAAGALVAGKTVTTELAFLRPNKTRNPHNPDHTPGGSSSGSAAAVADHMVPLAIGTQTGGSVIRPASFCGVTGFKPSLGAIPRAGVLMQSHSLDTVGVFAQDPAGAALLASVLSGRDMTLPAVTTAAPPPVLGRVTLPGSDRADARMMAGLADLPDRLGVPIVDLDLPEIFEDAAAQRAILNMAEMAHYYRRYHIAGADRLGPETRDAIDEGFTIPAHVYLEARARQRQMQDALAPLFARCDALLCPAAPGPAPKGLHSTGDAIFNGLWTMAGTPAITLPLLTSETGLPLGVQLVGPKGADAHLLRVADWLWARRSAAR